MPLENILFWLNPHRYDEAMKQHQADRDRMAQQWIRAL